jgi:hypothetical protein
MAFADIVQYCGWWWLVVVVAVVVGGGKMGVGSPRLPVIMQ